MKTILVPVDFSEISAAVVRQASLLARAVDGRVVLLTVVVPPVPMGEYAAPTDIEEVIAAGEQQAARELAKIELKLRDDGVRAESIQSRGAPVLVIAGQAERMKVDYIVMGSHGHTAFYDLLVGSTTQGVLRRAKCPVVIVPAAKAG